MAVKDTGEVGKTWKRECLAKFHGGKAIKGLSQMDLWLNGIYVKCKFLEDKKIFTQLGKKG